MANSTTSSDKIKHLLTGAAAGAIALAVVGFGFSGWKTGGGAEKMAATRAETATVAALAPVCVQAFRSLPDAGLQLASLQKLGSSDQRSFVEKGGWATAIGGKAPDSAVARACADNLSKLKAADLG